MHNFSRARLLLESRVIAAMGNDRQQKGKGKGGSKNEGQTQKPFLQGGGLGVHLSCNGTEEKAMNQAWAQGKEHTWSCFETEAKKLTLAIHERQMMELKAVIDGYVDRGENELEEQLKDEATSADKVKRMSFPMWRKQEQLAMAILMARHNKKLKKAERKQQEVQNDDSITSLKRRLETMEQREIEQQAKRARDARELGKRIADEATEKMKAKFHEEDLKRSDELRKIRDQKLKADEQTEAMKAKFLEEDQRRSEELTKLRELLTEQTKLNEDLTKALCTEKNNAENEVSDADTDPPTEAAQSEKLYLTCAKESCEGCWTGSDTERPAGCGVCGGAWAKAENEAPVNANAKAGDSTH